MSDTPGGPGWWMADDGKWYAPEQRVGGATAPPPNVAARAPTGDRRRVGVVLAVVAVAAVGLLLGVSAALVLLTGDDEIGSPDGGEVRLEPAHEVGDDPFTHTAFVRTPNVDTKVERFGDDAIGSSRGSTPGLYGGTRDERWCDPVAVAGFLESNPDHADAFVGALSTDPSWGSRQRTAVGVDELLDYFDTLTPVLLTADTRVTNHGYRDGEPLPFQAVLQAGTAVLIDTDGVPRVRCACSNPLTGPESVSGTITYTGPQWPGFDATRLTVVEPASEPIEVFILTDVRTGERFEQTAGTGDVEPELDTNAPPPDVFDDAPGRGGLPMPPPGITLTDDTPCPPDGRSGERVQRFAGPPPNCLRPDASYRATFATPLGEFTAELDVDAAPATVNNFVVLSRYRYYDGVPFHRVVPGFVIQAGDGDGPPWGRNDLGYTIDDELPRSSDAYVEYALAMANAGPNTNGSQFFIVLPGGVGQLQPLYSLFGRVVEGREVVDAISAIPVIGEEPIDAVLIDSITISETR